MYKIKDLIALRLIAGREKVLESERCKRAQTEKLVILGHLLLGKLIIMDVFFVLVGQSTTLETENILKTIGLIATTRLSFVVMSKMSRQLLIGLIDCHEIW